ncbi:hypothetical protein pipiens_010044 [Culex pipiens pipiens]|uniref:Uncharacterized protein n=1 Tax=Culex pipiens pipiens TaxID=38569 RepID=A0ABD1DBL1_CULPP
MTDQNWFGAVDCCNHHGMRLATVNDETEHASLETELRNLQLRLTQQEAILDWGKRSGRRKWRSRLAGHRPEHELLKSGLDNKSQDAAKHCVELNHDPAAEILALELGSWRISV